MNQDALWKKISNELLPQYGDRIALIGKESFGLIRFFDKKGLKVETFDSVDEIGNNYFSLAYCQNYINDEANIFDLLKIFKEHVFLETLFAIEVPNLKDYPLGLMRNETFWFDKLRRIYPRINFYVCENHYIFRAMSEKVDYND